MVIAIDGYSGTGKSSTAKVIAKELGFNYIDTGAMYRAVALYFLENNVISSDDESVKKALENILVTFENVNDMNTTFLNGKSVEDQIRSMEVSSKVSEVAALPLVRRKLVVLQRLMGEKGSVVMDGRDIGTNVFPNADLKLFMTASVEVRALRRQLELSQKGENCDLESIANNLSERDHIDSSRAENPLVKASDAVEIDTSSLTFDEQVQKILEICKELI